MRVWLLVLSFGCSAPLQAPAGHMTGDAKCRSTTFEFSAKQRAMPTPACSVYWDWCPVDCGSVAGGVRLWPLPLPRSIVCLFASLFHPSSTREHRHVRCLYLSQPSSHRTWSEVSTCLRVPGQMPHALHLGTLSAARSPVGQMLLVAARSPIRQILLVAARLLVGQILLPLCLHQATVDGATTPPTLGEQRTWCVLCKEAFSHGGHHRPSSPSPVSRA